MRATWLHLRFPFVYVLAPIFVWGAWRAAGPWGSRTTLGFLLVHLALYPGANAFNSAYDRDTGPIGGLARPPAVPRGLAGCSTALQATGFVLAPLIGWPFALAYGALWGIFTAYSHPRTRWKRWPSASTAAIVVGQGGLGFALGWLAAGGGPVDAAAGWSVLVAAAGVAALYPLTQLYQVDADAGRADWTLAARLGVGGTLRWVAAGFAVVAGSAWALGLTGLALYALLAALGALGMSLMRRPGWVPTHRWVMRVAYVNSTIFILYLTMAMIR
ncbi:MAG: UbiA family prenyltransferase [Gemmatimonadota bacterium]